MNSTLRFALLTACLLLLVGVGPVYAGPAPADGPARSGGATAPSDVFQTALFALGEVDLSTLGVSATELLTVGPQLNLTSSNGDGMLIVDNDGLDCPNWEYMTIQEAVDDAVPGDKIKVCRGTYMEQVTIPAGKDGLTLFSEPALQAVIKSPPVLIDPKAIVRISGAQNVTIRHFTITGPGGLTCDNLRYGVRVDNYGSALITDNHITEIRDTPSGGCQNGIGVDIGRVSDNGIGTGTVVHNLIDKYQKGGVLVSNEGSEAEVAYNEVVGVPSAVIAQNGIQASAGAVADIHHNKVSQNIYYGEDEATGILLYLEPVARVHHNDVFLNEDGIALCTVHDTGTVSYDNSRNNDYGIFVYMTDFCQTSTGNLISYNKAFENTILDCRDDNGSTANQWIKDLGRTAFPMTICKQAGPQP